MGDDLRRVSAHDRNVRPSEYEPREDEIGPVDFLAVEFPDGRIGAADLRELLSLVTQGTIRILDAEFIVKDAAGNARKADAAELGEPDGTGIGAWSGASSACSTPPMSSTFRRRSGPARPRPSSSTRTAGSFAWPTAGGAAAPA